MSKIIKLSAASGAIAAVIFSGYCWFFSEPESGTVGSLERAEVVTRQDNPDQTVPAVDGGAEMKAESAPIYETEIAGGDTCTVLPQKIELPDGTLCEVADDIPFMAEDEPVNYKCSDGNWLVGQPDKTEKVWTIHKVILSPGASVPASRIESVSRLDIRKVWR